MRFSHSFLQEIVVSMLNSCRSSKPGFNFQANAYQQKDPLLCNALLSKFSAHLWYLSDEAVALGFFDKNNSVEIKKIIVQSLNLSNKDTVPRRIYATPADIILNYNAKDLTNFVTRNTKNFFNRFNIPMEFLNYDPSHGQIEIIINSD